MKLNSRIVAFLLLILFLCLRADAGGVKIESPQGGWRNSSKEKLKFTQAVTYPASSVNTSDEQSKFALIKGKITGTDKTSSEAPYKLIVNGIAMPITVSGNSFSRPYFFGSGSNGVEIRSPDGKDRNRIQFYESNPNMVQPKLTVLLSWDTDQTDLDLHIVSPDGNHVWYGQRVSENGGALDVDVTTGYGPEIYSTPAPIKGTYLVYVNYYGSGPRDDMTLVQVTVVTNQNSVDEKKQTISVPMRRPGDLTLVHFFTVP